MVEGKDYLYGRSIFEEKMLGINERDSLQEFRNFKKEIF